MADQKMRFLLVATSIGVAFFSCIGGIQASLITSSGGMPGVTGIVTFSDQPQQFTLGPTQVGNLVGENIVFTASGPSGGFSYPGYGLVSNGTWGANGFRYAFIDNGTNSSIRFVFNDGPVSAVGGFVNYVPDLGFSGDFIIRALDSSFNVIEQYNISTGAPISTPNGVNAGAFRGIVRSSNDIFAFELKGGVGVIDDLTFFRSEVPEPASVTLFGLMAAGGAFYGWRRRKQAVVA